MKRFFLLLTSLLMTLALMAGCAAPASEQNDAYVFDPVRTEEEMLVRDLKTFVYGDPEIAIESGMTASDTILNRTAFTSGDNGSDAQGEKAAAARIERLLEEYGYADRAAAGTEFDRTMPYYEVQAFTIEVSQSSGLLSSKTIQVSSQNIAAVVPAAEEKSLGTVILAAHYDNSYGSDLIQGTKTHGVYGGAIATAAVLRAADSLSRAGLPFDLKFVFFGADEPGAFGASHFVRQMTASEIADTLVMVNFDALGGGDETYLFADDAETEHEAYFRAAAAAAGAKFGTAPADKKAILTNSSGRVYTHYGFLGDNSLFYDKGVNAVAFFGANWTAPDRYGYTESETKRPILGTAEDTLYRVQELYPDYARRAADAVDTFATAVTGEAFAETMRASRANRPQISWLQNSAIMGYITCGLVVLFAAAAMILAGVMMKRKPAPEDLVQPPAPEEVFGDYTDKTDKEDGPNGGTPPPDNPFEGY